MKKYKVYFELFGKKMVTEVSALEADRAKEIVKNKIVFHKVEPIMNNDDKKRVQDFFNGIF